MGLLQTQNVGIGTTTPHAQLQLANTAANRKFVLLESANNDHQFYGLGINTSMLRYQVDATTSNHVFFAGINASASNELMRIQGNGNVGIGTSTPHAPLQLANTAGNRKIVLLESANNEHEFYGIGINTSMLRYQVDATTSSHTFFAGTSATTSNELMRIKGNGNVNIAGFTKLGNETQSLPIKTATFINNIIPYTNGLPGWYSSQNVPINVQNIISFSAILVYTSIDGRKISIPSTGTSFNGSHKFDYDMIMETSNINYFNARSEDTYFNDKGAKVILHVTYTEAPLW